MRGTAYIILILYKFGALINSEYSTIEYYKETIESIYINTAIKLINYLKNEKKVL